MHREVVADHRAVNKSKQDVCNFDKSKVHTTTAPAATRCVFTAGISLKEGAAFHQLLATP
jgi:hypothetical protein